MFEEFYLTIIGIVMWAFIIHTIITAIIPG